MAFGSGEQEKSLLHSSCDITMFHCCVTSSPADAFKSYARTRCLECLGSTVHKCRTSSVHYAVFFVGVAAIDLFSCLLRKYMPVNNWLLVGLLTLPGLLCPSLFVSQIICVPDHLCPRLFVSQIICVPGYLCPRSFVSLVICVPDHLCPWLCVPDHLCPWLFVSQLICVPGLEHFQYIYIDLNVFFFF